MMSFVDLIRPLCPPEMSARGQKYFYQGRVALRQYDRGTVSARVHGSMLYFVTIEALPGGRVKLSCDCPAFADRGCCKHVYATALAADKALRDDSNTLAPVSSLAKKPAPAPVSWQHALSNYHPDIVPEVGKHIRVRYLFQPPDSAYDRSAGICVEGQPEKKGGGWLDFRDFRPNEKNLAALENAEDRQIILGLCGARTYQYDYSRYSDSSTFYPDATLLDFWLPRLAVTGRLFLREKRNGPVTPLRIAEGGPWAFSLRLEPAGKDLLALRGRLVRGDEHIGVADAKNLSNGRWFVRDGALERIETTATNTLRWCRMQGAVLLPAEDAASFLRQAMARLRETDVELDEATGWRREMIRPVPKLFLSRPDVGAATNPARLDFEHDGKRLDPDSEDRSVVDAQERTVRSIDPDAIKQAQADLATAGVRRRKAHSWAATLRDHDYEIPLKHTADAVHQLIAKGWKVAGEGKLYRSAKSFNMAVTSGVDWFELRGSIDFDGATAGWPALLKALRAKQNSVALDDGTIGLLPEEWLRRYGGLAELGEGEKDHIRFSSAQSALLDAMLAEQDNVVFDEGFLRVREELHSFSGIAPREPPPGFSGTLRPYQRDAMGWFDFLRRFNWGGCLADDMGLGKTVQVLALLEERRAMREGKTGADDPGPSLAVVPKSLLFNWASEAKRFAPKLRVLTHIGTDRDREAKAIAASDLVLTTYGTLRRDIAQLRNVTFDYVILDEAQAVKNSTTGSAKAVRLLRGRHRLALSGTPVENHLGELWSLFEFLNPGLLGRTTAFSRATENADDDARKMLARAVRPFLLRRTKAQVAPDLPPRQEETLFCDLPDDQRKKYDELRDHYRATLLGVVDEQGLNKSKLIILEALLRLRQAACHPKLIDPKIKMRETAKFSMLIPQLQEIAEEGHKVLVFSQFTSLLALLKKELKPTGLNYEYLDGKTKDRQAAVQKFQNDPACPLFLISLKAGGLGLNLTAAEYVYLLDPWWNPAVEAQAIDRAHRIGQTKPVFAYRLIARGTVEEHILELQATKRELADAIVNAGEGGLRGLTRADLELLLA